MASSFNLNTFLQEYKSYNNRTYTAAENGQAAMEQRAVKQAEDAVKSSGFLTLTLSEKLAELGIGEKAIKQFGDTAVNMVKGIVEPVADYLEKYENIFDQNKYTEEIQSYAKQMFFANQALSQDAASRDAGQNFVYQM